MRILLLTHSLCGIDLAIILKLQGHDIDIVVFNPQVLGVGDGFGLNIDIDYQRAIDRALDGYYDLVINDDVYMGNASNLLRKHGVPVFGGSLDTDVWENSRLIGMEVMKNSGIDISECFSFDSYSDVYDFLKWNDGLWVLKGSGTEGLMKSKTIVPVCADELLWYVNELMKETDEAKVILQKKLDGVEVAWSFWWNGVDVVGDAWMNFEHKRMFTGNMGPFCGEAGTMVIAISPDFIRKKFSGLFSWLQVSGYRGIMDINTIVMDDGTIYGLEFTPRMGYPIMQCITRQLLYGGIGDIGEYLRKIAISEDVQRITDNARYGCVIGYFIKADMGDVPVFFEDLDDLNEVILKYVGIDNAAWNDEFKCFVGKSGDGYLWYRRVLLGIGVAERYDKAIGRALRIMRRFYSIYGWYRMDIGMDIDRYNAVMDIFSDEALGEKQDIGII